MKLNAPFVLRTLILILGLLSLSGLGLILIPREAQFRLFSMWVTRPLETTPLPPTLTVPRGPLPPSQVGLQAWAVFKDGSRQLRGSGFLLKLNDGQVIGVTTAHSLGDLGAPGNNLMKIAWLLPSDQSVVAEADSLHGDAGVARTTFDLTVDYVLLRLNGSVPPAYLLTPDPRGAPQLGERVSLFSGLGDTQGQRRELPGTVFEASAQGFSVVFADWFDPSMMSGSPVLSQHTGQVLGMAIMMSPRGDKMTLGFHPIGNLVKLAEGAKQFPRIDQYQR